MVIHHILTENEQEKTLTHTISNNTQLYQSIHLTHIQAISSTVKSHNHSTLEKKAAQTAKKKKKSSSSSGPTLDYKKIRDVLHLLTEEVCFLRRLE